MNRLFAFVLGLALAFGVRTAWTAVVTPGSDLASGDIGPALLDPADDKIRYSHQRPTTLITTNTVTFVGGDIVDLSSDIGASGPLPAHGANGIYFSGTATSTGTSTLTDTSTSVATVTDTFTATGTGTGSISSTDSASGTGTYSRTLSGTNTRTLTAAITQTTTGTSSGTSTASSFVVQSNLTFTATGTATYTITVNGTGSSTTTATGTSTITGTITAGQTATGTNSGAVIGTAGGVATYSYTMSRTSTATATGTITESSTFTGTVTQTGTGTVAVSSYSATGTGTGSGTGTSTHTWYPTSTRTVTSTSTATATATTTDLRYETTIIGPAASDVPGGDRFFNGCDNRASCEGDPAFDLQPPSAGEIAALSPTVGSPVDVFSSSTGWLTLAQGSGATPTSRWISRGTIRVEFWAGTTSPAQIAIFLDICSWPDMNGIASGLFGTTTVNISGSTSTKYTVDIPVADGVQLNYSRTFCIAMAAYATSGTPTITMAGAGTPSTWLKVNGPWILPQ